MDTLTHALSGALLARATEPAAARPDQLARGARMWVGFWAAAFPDTDFILNFIDPLTYLTAHRGMTHSIVLLPLWASGLALLFTWFTRRRYSWRSFVGLCALGIGAHITGDVVTAFGTMVFTPLLDVRVAWPVTFIIDPYFTAIIVLGLAVSAIWKRTRIPAAFALAVLTAYVGFQGFLHNRALGVGAAYAATRGMGEPAIHALPQPFSPFHWMIAVENRDDYHLAYVSLARTTPSPPLPDDAGWWRKMYWSYDPPERARWTYVPRFGDAPAYAPLARALWASDTLAAYRRFALLPALYRVDDDGTVVCIWFNDLRFALVGRDMPFRYGACRDGRGPWRLNRLVGNGQPLLEHVPR